MNLIALISRLFQRKTVASVMSSFNEAVEDLNQIAAREAAEVERLRLEAREVEEAARQTVRELDAAAVRANNERARAEVLSRRISDFATA